MSEFPTTLILTILALAIVLVLAWLILRGLASMGVARNRNGALQIVESIPVGAKERIILLRYREHDYLLGVSNQGVSLIDKNAIDELSQNNTQPPQ